MPSLDQTSLEGITTPLPIMPFPDQHQGMIRFLPKLNGAHPPPRGS